jgi:aminopeptidase-like protein
LVGDSGPFTYKRSRRGSAQIDRVVVRALHDGDVPWSAVDFEPYGYDERQFCSPGVNLPVGRLTRASNGAYPEYHTSADNLDFITPQTLAQSLAACLRIVSMLENDRYYLNTSPKGEPQLGKRGLYRKSGGQKEVGQREYALLWVLNQSDGEHSLLDIAERSGLAFETIHAAARDLAGTGLLVPRGLEGEEES